MNMGSTLAAYASICKEGGRPFKFPGSKAQWNGLTDMTDARVLGKQLVWASTKDCAKNDAYNIANGIFFAGAGCGRVWPLGSALNSAGFEGEPKPLEGQMRDDGPIWKTMAERYSLTEPDLERVAVGLAYRP